MTAVPKLSDPGITAASDSLAQLRQELARRFPGVVLGPVDPGGGSSSPASTSDRGHEHEAGAQLLHAPFAWVEVAIGDGGLAWLAAWTSLVVARDPLGRPALWVDTHGTFTPGDLLDLEGKLVVVRPHDAHEAHVAADIALRAGSFCMVALEMHRALHPKPLARLARLASARSSSDRTRTQLILWGEPPSFVAPPSGVPRTPFNEAIHALYEGLATGAGDRSGAKIDRHGKSCAAVFCENLRGDRHDDPDPSAPREEESGFTRAPHTTDRLRPLDRAADRRASASGPRPVTDDGSGGGVDEHADRSDRPARLSAIPYARSTTLRR
jgi:hypothetical protein